MLLNDTLSRAVALFVLLAGLAAGQRIRLRATGEVELTPWRGALESAQAQFVVQVAGKADVPPLLGSYRVEQDTLIFTPRFSLQPGLRYCAVFKPANLTETFEAPRVETPPAYVEQVFPTADILPENQLKFYLHFSAPMSRGEAYRRVRLLDEGGKALQLPFLELDEELWDREGKRLTILFDPARIKRGLLPHEEAGVPIEEGKSYTLVIDREWLDAAGKPMKQGFRKQFRVGPADREPPDPKTWRLVAPKAGTSDALMLEFPEPMDRALLERIIEATDPRANPVPGSITIDRNETRWRFVPREPWKSGTYSLVVGRILEDLAGNTIGRPFEVDVFERVEERIYRETITIPFQID